MEGTQVSVEESTVLNTLAQAGTVQFPTAFEIGIKGRNE